MRCARAVSAALAPSREAIATTSTSGTSRMAGSIRLSANREAPRIPKPSTQESLVDRVQSGELCSRDPVAGARKTVLLNHDAVADDAVLGDDHDPLADVVAVAVLLLDARLVDDADLAADAGVLVDDGVLDDRLRSDADGRDAARDRRLHLVQRLVEVGADEEAVADADVVADAAADADHGAVDLRPVHDAPFGDECVVDVAAFELRRRQ